MNSDAEGTVASQNAERFATYDDVAEAPPGTSAANRTAADGLVPVAILTTDDFDAVLVDISTVLFASATAVHSALEDVDGDGETFFRRPRWYDVEGASGIASYPGTALLGASAALAAS